MGKQRQSSLAAFFVPKCADGDTVAAGASASDGQGGLGIDAGGDAGDRPSEAKRPRMSLAENEQGVLLDSPGGGDGGAADRVGSEPAGGRSASGADERERRWRVAMAMGKKAEFAAKRLLAAREEADFKGGLDLRSLLVNESWGPLLSQEFDKPYCAALGQFIAAELGAGRTVYPALPHVFRCFNSASVADVRAVIIGQDPYHDVGQAMGLSFSVPPGVPLPSSLRNIFKEVREDLGVQTPREGDLSRWAAEGVLLLNACLTVRAHAAASHAKQGWETFTDAAIRALSKNGRRGIVFMLWGKFAEGKRKLIDGTRGHHILVAPHPSGLSAHRGFYGCRHFSKANALLVRDGSEPIDWSLA